MDKKAKVNASYYVTKLLPNLIKDCSISYRTTSSFSKMAHLLTQQLLPKTGPRRNAMVSLEKTNGHRIRQISVHWIIMTADIHHWNVWTADEKVVQSLIRYFWIFKTRLHVHLKKWTLKFKLLYLLNHIRYFNKICRMCDLNPHL